MKNFKLSLLISSILLISFYSVSNAKYIDTFCNINNYSLDSTKVEPAQKDSTKSETPKKKHKKGCKKAKPIIKKSKTQKEKVKSTPKDTTKAVTPPKPAPSPYEKLTSSCTKKATGDFFGLYLNNRNQVFIEVPKKLSGRRFIANGCAKKVSNPQAINIGFYYNEPTYLKMNITDSLVSLIIPYDNVVSTDSTMKVAMARNYQPITYREYPVLGISPDSSKVIFEMTDIVNDLLPKTKDFRYSNSVAPKYDNLKSFEDNASLTITKNFEINKRTSSKSVQYGSITTSISFLLLPEKKMTARILDSRIGVFPASEENITDVSQEADGFKEFKYATRWRIEPVDTVAWLMGKMTKVKKPIIWYIDDSFPENWKKPIKEGILIWNRAFEKIGLKDVMVAKEFPKANQDSLFDPDNLKYSCIRYIPDATMNAMGPSWVDPTSGEILVGAVLVYNDVIKLINNWRFLLTSQVDERARTQKMPNDLLQESLRYVIAHEIGHTLGLMHNMGASSAIPVDSLRSPSFTAKYGTTPSIMDYARFNYVAQPGDKNLKLTPPDLGVYDEYAINWLYRPIPRCKNIWEESKIAEKIIDEKAGDPYFRYGAQQIISNYDPTSLTEDLGNDPIKAGNYGIKNLKFILKNMSNWIKDDNDYSFRYNIYTWLYSQYTRYIFNVGTQIGGMKITNVKEGTKGEHIQVVNADIQRESTKWCIDKLINSGWIADRELTKNFELSTPKNSDIQYKVTSFLISRVPSNLILANTYVTGKDKYSIQEYYEDLFKYIFKEGKLDEGRRIVQISILNSLLAINSNYLSRVPKARSIDRTCNFGGDQPIFQDVVKLGPYYDIIATYNNWFLKEIENYAKGCHLFMSKENKAHMKYLLNLMGK